MYSIIYKSIEIGRQSWLINNTFFYIHINAFLWKAIYKAMTRPNHGHIYSNQRKSSVFVNWMKQVCLQTRLKWWEWWRTSDIIWNRVPDRRRSKRKRAVTVCCLTVCRFIEKKHGVWAGASDAGVWWLFRQHMMVQYCCDSGSTNKLFYRCFLLWQ